MKFTILLKWLFRLKVEQLRNYIKSYTKAPSFLFCFTCDKFYGIHDESIIKKDIYFKN